MFEQIRSGAGEENLHGIFLSAHDAGEVASGRRTKKRLGIMLGTRLEKLAQSALGPVGPSVEGIRSRPPVVRRRECTALDQRIHESNEDTLLRFDHTKLIGGKSIALAHAHFAQSGGNEGCGEIVFLAHDLAHVFLSAQCDHIGARLGRCALQFGQRDFRRFHRPGRTGQPLPVEMVNKIAPTGRTTFFAEGERHRAESFNVDRRTSGLVVERNISLDQLVIVLGDLGLHVRFGPGTAQEQNAREADRKLHFFLQAFHGASARRENMQCGVHDDRMHGVIGGALGCGFGERD